MINSRLKNDTPNVRRTSDVPISHTASFQSGHAGEPKKFVYAGTPIGLLLALTYSTDQFLGYDSYGDFRPNVRITSV